VGVGGGTTEEKREVLSWEWNILREYSSLINIKHHV